MSWGEIVGAVVSLLGQWGVLEVFKAVVIMAVALVMIRLLMRL